MFNTNNKFKKFFSKLMIIIIFIISIVLIFEFVVIELNLTSEVYATSGENNNITKGFTDKSNPSGNLAYGIIVGIVFFGGGFLLILLSPIFVILCVGMCFLYSKIKIPNFAIVLTVLAPIICVIMFFYIFAGVYEYFILIIPAICLGIGRFYYFKRLNMSWFWSLLFVIAVALLQFPIISLIIFVIYVIGFIISNIKLLDLFELDGYLFMAGLIVFPHLFQPILGYKLIDQKKEVNIENKV